jgi:hypothetical protein
MAFPNALPSGLANPYLQCLSSWPEEGKRDVVHELYCLGEGQQAACVSSCVSAAEGLLPRIFPAGVEVPRAVRTEKEG